MRRLDGDPARRACRDDRSGSRRHRAADRPRRGLSCAFRLAWRADGRRRRAQHRSGGQASQFRDIDGIVLGEGFSARVVDAFLTVLAEDARFRNLPVVVTSDALAPAYDLPNLEILTGEPAHVAANACR